MDGTDAWRRWCRMLLWGFEEEGGFELVFDVDFQLRLRVPGRSRAVCLVD